MNVAVIELSGTLDGGCYRSFPRNLEDLDRLNLDMSSVYFCRPGGLVAVSSLIDFVVRRGVKVKVITPRESDARIYMARMRFSHFLDELNIEHDLSPVNERQARNRFLELSNFTNERGVLKLAELVHARFEPQIGAEAAASAFMAVTELGANVSEHAGCPRGFYMAQQFVRGNRFSFAIGDPGIGLRESLIRFGPEGDDAAIRLALERGVSSLEVEGRGEGFADIRDRVRAAGGYLNVVTGDAEGLFNQHTDRFFKEARGYFPGTLVSGTFPLR